jgi:hypothetical protein
MTTRIHNAADHPFTAYCIVYQSARGPIPAYYGYTRQALSARMASHRQDARVVSAVSSTRACAACVDKFRITRHDALATEAEAIRLEAKLIRTRLAAGFDLANRMVDRGMGRSEAWPEDHLRRIPSDFV